MTVHEIQNQLAPYRLYWDSNDDCVYNEDDVFFEYVPYNDMVGFISRCITGEAFSAQKIITAGE